MWLPTPIYERIPQFWLLIGLLFMSSGTYLGFDFGLSFLYFYTGFACAAWGAWILVKRRQTGSAPQHAEARPGPSSLDSQDHSVTSNTADAVTT